MLSTTEEAIEKEFNSFKPGKKKKRERDGEIDAGCVSGVNLAGKHYSILNFWKCQQYRQDS